MGAWEGIWLGMQAVEDAKYRDEQLDIQERKMTLLEKENKQAENLRTIKAFTSGFNIDIPKRSGTKLNTASIDTYTKALHQYLPPNIASKYIALNNTEALDNLLGVMQDYKKQQFEQGIDKVDKGKYGEIWDGTLVNSAMTYDAAEDYIFSAAEGAGVDVTNPTFLSWKEKAIERLTRGSAIIEPEYLVADLKTTEVKNVQDDIKDTSKLTMNSIIQDMVATRLSQNEDVVSNENLTLKGTIKPHIMQGLDKTRKRLEQLNDAQVIAFTSPDIFANKYSEPIYQNNNQLINFNQTIKANSITIDLAGDAITAPDPNNSSKRVVTEYSFYKSPTDNLHQWYVDYYLATGKKLIPEGTRIRTIDNTNNYFFMDMTYLEGNINTIYPEDS